MIYFYRDIFRFYTGAEKCGFTNGRGRQMKGAKEWKPLETDSEREVTSHREPGVEFLFYRSVAAGMIDAVQV